MGKTQIAIVDSGFMPCVKSASLREENREISPQNILWRSGYSPVDEKTVFVTDGYVGSDVGRNIPGVFRTCAWLIEPPDLRPENYAAAIKYQNLYNYIFTYDQKTLAQLDPAKRRFYALGGSSIAFDKWKFYPKTKDVCMFFSGKNTTYGHQYRKWVAGQLRDKIDVYGEGVGNPVDSKFEVLKDYRYCIVVESGQSAHYFTEKIIDPISVGTVPVYWGCPTIGMWFNEYGITPLEWVLERDGFEYWLTQERYVALASAMEDNIKRAKKYAICEDWMYNTYPEIFND